MNPWDLFPWFLVWGAGTGAVLLIITIPVLIFGSAVQMVRKQ